VDSEAGRVAEASAWLRRSRETLEAARILAREGFRPEAISRAYYAMFYSARALLMSRGIVQHKHSAVLAVIGREFVRSGLIDQSLHRALLDAFRDRQASDYVLDAEPTTAAVARRIEQAAELADAVELLLIGDQR
jgi:uncharacterized protein (UPF0332 family)